MNITIRKEIQSDYRTVEELTREAFWDLYEPGASEHFLVHKIRNSADVIPELDFIALIDETIVAHILFTHSFIEMPDGSKFKSITFGPVSVIPIYQKQGIGSALIKHALKTAAQLSHQAVFIYGYPDYYQRFGFQQTKAFDITDAEGRFHAAHLGLELHPNALKGITGKFYQSSLFDINTKELEIFERAFPTKEKKITPTQAKFSAMVNNYL